MKKTVSTKTNVIVDQSTGEVLQYESEKVYKEKINSDNFYMIFSDYSNRLYRVNSGVAHNVFIWLCTHAEFNTAKVSLTSADRSDLRAELDISDSQLTHALKILKDKSLITGERGRFIINPEVFWKGDQRIRKSELLKNKELEVTVRIVDSEDKSEK